MKTAGKEIVGEVTILASEIYNNKSLNVVIDTKGIITGRLIIETRNMNNYETLVFTLSADNVDKMDFIGHSDVFFKLFRLEDNAKVEVYCSEVIKNSQNPEWKPVRIPLKRLIDQESEFLLECYDKDSMWNDFIGGCTIQIQKLLCNSSFELFKKSKNKPSGILKVSKASLRMQKSFLEHVSLGLEVCLAVAVDFSAKNMELHKLKPNDHWNIYQIFLGMISSKSNDLFPAYGFGAEFNGQQNFCLGLDNNPYVSGAEKVVSKYINCLSNLHPSQNANLSPVILDFCNQISKILTKKYHVLIILSSGYVDDVVETKNAFEVAASLPMSIVFVDFGKTESISELLKTKNEVREFLSHVKYTESNMFNFENDLIRFISTQASEYAEMIQFNE